MIRERIQTDRIRVIIRTRTPNLIRVQPRSPIGYLSDQSSVDWILFDFVHTFYLNTIIQLKFSIGSCLTSVLCVNFCLNVYKLVL